MLSWNRPQDTETAIAKTERSVVATIFVRQYMNILASGHPPGLWRLISPKMGIEDSDFTGRSGFGRAHDATHPALSGVNYFSRSCCVTRECYRIFRCRRDAARS